MSKEECARLLVSVSTALLKLYLTYMQDGCSDKVKHLQFWFCTNLQITPQPKGRGKKRHEKGVLKLLGKRDPKGPRLLRPPTSIQSPPRSLGIWSHSVSSLPLKTANNKYQVCTSWLETLSRDATCSSRWQSSFDVGWRARMKGGTYWTVAMDGACFGTRGTHATHRPSFLLATSGWCLSSSKCIGFGCDNYCGGMRLCGWQHQQRSFWFC